MTHRSQAVYGGLNHDIRHGKYSALNTCGKPDSEYSLQTRPINLQLSGRYTDLPAASV